MTEIKQCTCKHEFQDVEYGKGMRVHNSNEKSEWKCTVCGSTKKMEGASKKK